MKCTKIKKALKTILANFGAEGTTSYSHINLSRPPNPEVVTSLDTKALQCQTVMRFSAHKQHGSSELNVSSGILLRCCS